MMDRVRCVVPYCRCTTQRRWEGQEWICGKHWRLVDRRLKAINRRLRRRAQNRRFHLPLPIDHLLRVGVHVWQRCKKQAIERAVGISA